MQTKSTATILAAALAVSLSTLLAAQTLRVSIDIKPGDKPTTIEPGRQGVIPVAILTTPQFDAATVETATVSIGPTGTEAAAFRSMLDDVDRDGDADQLLLFRVQEMGVKCGDTVILLKGKTTDGKPIEGSQSIETVGCTNGDRQ